MAKKKEMIQSSNRSPPTTNNNNNKTKKSDSNNNLNHKSPPTKKRTKKLSSQSSTTTNDKVLITVETQTDPNDFCYCFIPEFACRHNDRVELDSHICVKLDKIKDEQQKVGNRPTIVVRNFECKNCRNTEPKKRWKFAGNSLRAISKFRRKDIYDVSYNTHDIGQIHPEKSGIYVMNSIDYSETVTSTPSTNSKRRKRFSLTNIWKWKRNRHDEEEDERNGSVLRVQSFAYTPASRLPKETSTPLPPDPKENNVDEQETRYIRKNSYKDGEESNTLRMQRQFHSQPRLYRDKDEYKPVLHDKSQSVHDMKKIVSSVDSFDKFCAESPETSTTKRSLRKHMRNNGSQQQIEGKVPQKEKKVLSRSNSNASLKKNSKNSKLSKASSFNEKITKKRSNGTKRSDKNNSDDVIHENDVIRKQRPKSNYWNPTKVVAEIVEMERQQLLEEQRAYTAREGKTELFTSYYDLQRASARDRQGQVDKEFNEYLIHQRKLLLATRDSRTFDPLREGVATDRLATPNNNDSQPTKSKQQQRRRKPQRLSTASDSSRHSRTNESKTTSPNESVRSNRSTRDRKSKTHSILLKESTTDSPVSSKDGQHSVDRRLMRQDYQRLSTDESIHSASLQKRTKQSSVASDSDLSVFALVPGTNLHRKLSVKGRGDRAPVNVINQNKQQQIDVTRNDDVITLSNSRTFSSTNDLLSTNQTPSSNLQTSLSADDINDAHIMSVVSSRSSKDLLNTSASARSKASSGGSFKFKQSIDEKLLNGYHPTEELMEPPPYRSSDVHEHYDTVTDDDVFYENNEMYGTFV